MSNFRKLAARVRGLWSRRSMDRRLREEFECHLDLLEQAALRRGLSPEEARFAARRDFGGVEQARQVRHDTRGWPALEAFLQDIRLAVRGIRRAPGFALMVMAVLAVGIGAGTTVFSILNTLFYRPLHYPDPGRLVIMGEAYTKGQQVGPMAPVRYLDYLEWQKQAQSFSHIAAYKVQPFILSSGSEPERIRGEHVAAGYFRLLGVRPMLGRDFVPEDYAPGAPAVFLLSEEYWRRALNSRPDIVGAALRLNGLPATVIGVMPGGLRATLIEGGPKAWSPLIPGPAELTYGRGTLSILARLKPGVTLASARAEMTVVGKRLAAQHPDPDRDPAVRVDGFQATLDWAASAPVAKVLITTVVCLLLISCVNAACLLLGRAAERCKEVALRNALGAGRFRLVRQFLSESLVFALAGGLAGVAVACFTTSWCTAKIGPLLAYEGIDRFDIDSRVLAFTLLVSIATAIVFGILPAIRGSSVDVSGTLKESGTGHSAGSSRLRLTSLLVSVEVALSVVLVTSGGLLLNSIREYWRFDWGVPLDHRMAMQAAPIDRVYDTDEKLLRFYGQLLARARELPGVQSAALVNAMPLHYGASTTRVRSEGSQPLQAGHRVISPGYHATAGLSLRAGRSFTEADSPGRAPVALISESLAGRLWPGKDPIGERVEVNGTWRTVVGITANLPQSLLKMPDYEICVPYTQAPPNSIRVLLHTSGDPAPVAAALRQTVRKLDPDLPIGEIRTLHATKREMVARFEFIMGLLCVFALAALVLAGAGIYGVTSRAVAIRTREIGIRIALGADSRQVLRHVMRSGLKLALAGTFAGSLLALMMIKLLLTRLWWMSPVSSFFWIVPVAILMAVLAMLASLEPARRATRIATVQALRAE